MSKKISLGAGLAMAAAAAAVTVSLTYVYAMNSFNSKVADVNERQAMYAKLSEIDQKARQEYVGEIDEQALTDAICAGYVAGLGDSGAKYYSAARYQEYRAGLTGRNVGVGVSTAFLPTGLSGWVKTAATSKPASSTACKGGTEKAGAPA